ncbi:TfuA-like protein [Pseudonocardia adelaidensis]|uniref:TfuA-like core domain-containing protein n=1 Tax=Pseudonocardia adelaidensis TaxID=648754 RepID=A0ABP9NGH0_9PSEU
MRPIVYLGPTLPRQEAARLLEADFRPPVRRGDLPRRYGGTVVIIDGEFGQSLSVSPNEILRLLDTGTRVLGAASMGALRAAELHPLGMEGHGWVFEAYRTGLVEADDEVALLYSPPDMRPLTVPLINARAWLYDLQAAREVDACTARVLLRRARRIFFADRTEPRLRAEWVEVVGEPELRRLLRLRPRGITDIKAEDARVVLRAARHPNGRGDQSWTQRGASRAAASPS